EIKAEGWIDDSYGYLRNDGPCSKHDASFSNRWHQDSIDVTGSDYTYPNTRLQVILGSQDDSPAVAEAHDYIATIRAAGGTVTETDVATMGHTIQDYPDGLSALNTALLYGQPVSPGPSGGGSTGGTKTTKKSGSPGASPSASATPSS